MVPSSCVQTALLGSQSSLYSGCLAHYQPTYTIIPHSPHSAKHMAHLVNPHQCFHNLCTFLLNWASTQIIKWTINAILKRTWEEKEGAIQVRHTGYQKTSLLPAPNSSLWNGLSTLNFSQNFKTIIFLSSTWQSTDRKFPEWNKNILLLWRTECQEQICQTILQHSPITFNCMSLEGIKSQKVIQKGPVQ